MAGHRHDLVRRRAGLGETTARCLAQAVSRALRQAGGIAGIAKPILEPALAERRAVALTRNVRPVVGSSACSLGCTGITTGSLASPSFFCRKVEHAVAQMLAAEPDGVGAARRGVEQQRHREMLARADRPPRLELRDLLLGPGVVALGLDLAIFTLALGSSSSHAMRSPLRQHVRSTLSSRLRCAG